VLRRASFGPDFAARGHEVRLMSPEYVRPYVKAQKTDDRDAETIAEAATRPAVRFVELKSQEQLNGLSYLRCSDRSGFPHVVSGRRRPNWRKCHFSILVDYALGSGGGGVGNPSYLKVLGESLSAPIGQPVELTRAKSKRRRKWSQTRGPDPFFQRPTTRAAQRKATTQREQPRLGSMRPPSGRAGPFHL
jgi:hypothetical protein